MSAGALGDSHQLRLPQRASVLPTLVSPNAETAQPRLRVEARPGVADDEDVLAAAVLDRGPVEVAIEGLDLEARHIDETEPLVLRFPPPTLLCARSCPSMTSSAPQP